MLRGLAVWLLIMAVETLHGVLRQLFLVPRVGEAWAGRIGWPVAAVLVICIATAAARWMDLKGPSAQWRLGMIWAALTFIFEIAVGLWRGLDAQHIMAEINPFSGGLLLLSVAVILVAPRVGARLRGS
jgi:hypothetical protein